MIIDNIIALADIESQEYRIILCKMNGETIREITNQSFEKSYSPKLGGCDEFSFSIYKEYDGKPVMNYDDIRGRNLIKLMQGDNEIGLFEIQNPIIKNDGVKEFKNITTLSYEIKLINKKMYLTEGTFRFFDDINIENGIINTVFKDVKSWSIGYIDPVLINKERYFDISDTNIYQLLVGQIQETFECIFIFNTINKTVNAYGLEGFGNTSPIIVSMDNIIQDANVEEISDEIVTKLHLYGENDLTIRDINYGQDSIVNYSYFKNTDFMSQSLIDAIDTHDILVDSASVTYSGYLSTLSVLNAQLIVVESDLSILENEMTSLMEQRSYLQSINQSTTSIQTQIDNKQIVINTKQNDKTTILSNMLSNQNAINAIVQTISMENNFTEAQLEELDQFIIGDTYQDSSFITTDLMTYADERNVQEDLLETGKNILARVSYPRYKIDINVIDFLKNKEFAYWWDKLHIGDIIKINIDDSFIVEVRVVSYTHDWDSNKLTIQLGDKYKFDDSTIELIDILKNSVNTSTNVNYERYKYKDYVKNSKNEVLGFINSSLDLNKNSVVGGTNQEMLFDPSGLLMRRWDSNTSNFSPKQLKITNNAIVLTDDAFTNAKTAIGQLANGSYGIAAEIIAGKMILGNNLIIETGNGDFRVDGDGVNITNLSINMVSDDNLKNIIIDPNDGFKMRTRTSTSQVFQNSLYVDPVSKKLKFNGDLEAVGGTFNGNLSAVGGTFTGTLSGVDGTFTGTLSGNTITSATILSANINISQDIYVGNSVYIGSQASVGTKLLSFYVGGWDRVDLLASNGDLTIRAQGGQIGTACDFLFLSGDQGVNINSNFSDINLSPANGKRAMVNFNEIITTGNISPYLSGYATKSWVNSQGFVGYSALSNYATRSYAVQDYSSQGIEMQYFNDHVEFRLSGQSTWKKLYF